MFRIDEDGSIEFMDHELRTGEDGHFFENLAQLSTIAEVRNWTKDAVTEIYNGFAGTPRFGDLKPQKMFKNRPYGLAAIWKAIQRLDPSQSRGEAPMAETPAPAVEPEHPKALKKTEKAKKPAPAELKKGSAVETLLRLVGRKSGASLDELVNETGLLRHSIRGRISTLNSSGTKIESFKDDKRGRCYRAA